MTPRVIHQIWLGQSKRPVEWMETWRTMNPTWEYKLWTEENMPASLIKNFNACPSYSGKADILRYQLLYEQGGMYIDADSECIEPLDDRFLNPFCIWENEWWYPGLMANGFMGDVKGSPLMKAILDEIETLDMGFSPVDTWKVLGPLLLTKKVAELKYTAMEIYPSYYFLPKHYTGLEYKGTGKVFAKHYWGSTPNRV